jgi:hypothetical protein
VLLGRDGRAKLSDVGLAQLFGGRELAKPKDSQDPAWTGGDLQGSSQGLGGVGLEPLRSRLASFASLRALFNVQGAPVQPCSAGAGVG